MTKECYIVGGGPSLGTFNHSWLCGKDVIVVNQSLFHVPNAKYFVTMDYTWVLRNGIAGDKKVRDNRNREFRRHPAEKIFVVGFSGDRLKVLDDWHIVDVHHGITYDLSSFDRVVHASEYGGLGNSFNDFHCGSDSGFSGVQLAVVLGYEKVILLGYDFRVAATGTHFHNDYADRDRRLYDEKLKEFMCPYPMMLEKARRDFGVQVYSGSVMSRLNRYIPYVKVG